MRKNHFENRLKLIQKYNDALSLPDSARLMILIRIKASLLEVFRMPRVLDAGQREKVRHLVSELVTIISLLNNLSGHFSNADEILDQTAESTGAMQRFVANWKQGLRPEMADLESADALLDLYDEVLKNVKQSEVRVALERTMTQLTPQKA